MGVINGRWYCPVFNFAEEIIYKRFSYTFHIYINSSHNMLDASSIISRKRESHICTRIYGDM